MRNSKQAIKCDVYDCKHCDCDNECCCLKEIKICNCDEESKKESTMCDNYKKKKD